MISGQPAGLRARLPEDVPVLHAELHDDVVTRSQADSRPWSPRPATGGHSPYEPAPPSANAAVFSVVELASGDLAGEALLWGIDTHNRCAHLGISLRPSLRGRGWGGRPSSCCAATASRCAPFAASRSRRSPATRR
ncbi:MULTISPECIES: GNAT family N-acetyltransferase [unclassified Streptomyces]|uniref:GNAT family N-acetyltransferase n=1 Tax=unclassified Streptomyces TaxID=2593676 RepID=UPI0007C700B3